MSLVLTDFVGERKAERRRPYMENDFFYGVYYYDKFSQPLDNLSQNKQNTDSRHQNINPNQNFFNTIVKIKFLKFFLEKYSGF